MFIFLTLLLLFFLLSNLEKITFGRAVRLLTRRFQKAEEQNQSKDQLFSILSHDLRSAVRTLQINISRLNSLLSQLKANEAVVLARSTERLIGTIQSLLDNLLYWSLSQTGQLRFQHEKIAVKPLLDQVCYDFVPIAASKNMLLTYRAADNHFCTGDMNSVKIMLRNLLDNAIKYTPEYGMIRVSAVQEGDRCTLVVQDNGIGMDEETIAAVWNTDTRRIQQDVHGRRSTGLGLWLVKTMVENNGGRVEIWSEKGVGTRVTIILPATA